MKYIRILGVFFLITIADVFSTDVRDEEFYIFDVGQGNCQLAAFKKKFGVLYDCGSLSSRIHPKLDSLQGEKCEKRWNAVFERKKVVHKPPAISEEGIKGSLPKKKSPKKMMMGEDMYLSEKESEGFMSASFSSNISAFSGSHTGSLEVDTGVSRNGNIKDFINGIIEDFNFQHLFIVLSHPDADHIKFVDKKTIPSGLSVTAFLEGDWLGKGAQNSHRNALSQDVCSVCTFLKERPATNVIMPYYRNGLLGYGEGFKEEKIEYSDIQNQWKNDDSQSFSKTYNLYKDCHIQTEKFLPFVTLTESLNNFKIDTIHWDSWKDDLKNIKIAHSGSFPFDDVNSQSALVAVTMPDMKMHFILTGDAHAETLALLDGQTFEKEKGYLSLVMLPHHGALGNKAFDLFKFFRPDVMGISAGNGASFKHPSRQLIRDLEEAMLQKKYKISGFSDIFCPGQENNFFYFDEPSSEDKKSELKGKKEKKRKALLHKQEEKKFPFICTNVLGTIRIHKGGFYAPFLSLIQDESDNFYQVSYTKELENFKEEGAKEIGENIFQKDGFFYFKVSHMVQNEEKTRWYPASKLEKEVMEVE